MEMALATSGASNTARKLQLSANCWPARRAGYKRGREREILKQNRCIAKKIYNFSGPTDRTFVWPELNDF